MAISLKETGNISNLVTNVLHVYKYAFDSDFACLDFSGVDLTNTSLDEFTFSKGEKSAVFGDAIFGSKTFAISGHEDSEIIYALSLNGSKLLSRSDNSLRLWDTVYSKCTEVIFDSADISEELLCLDVSFSSDGNKCSYSNDKIIFEHDFSEDRDIIFAECDSTVVSIAYSPSGQVLVCTDCYGKVYVYDVLSKTQIITKSIISARNTEDKNSDSDTIEFRCDCSDSYFAYPNNKSKEIHLLEFIGGTERILSSKNCIETTCVRFAQTKPLVLTAHGDYGKKSHINIWDLKTLKLLRTITDAHDDRILDLKYSTNGEYFASCSEDGSVKVWTQRNDKPAFEFNVMGSAYSIEFSDDSKLLYIGNDRGTVQVEYLRDTGYFLTYLDGHLPYVYDIKTDKNDLFCLGAYEDGIVREWSLSNGQLVYEYDIRIVGISGAIYCVAYSNDNEFFACGCNNGEIHLWSIRDKNYIGTLYGHTDTVRDIVFTADDDFIISSSNDYSIRMWNLKTGKEAMSPVRKHEDNIKCLLLYECNEYRRLVSASNDGLVVIWKMEINKGICKFDILKELNEHSGRVRGLTVFEGNENFVKFASFSEDGTIKEWDIQNGELLNEIKIEQTNYSSYIIGVKKFEFFCSAVAVCYNKDGSKLIIGYDDYETGECGLQEICLEENKFLKRINIHQAMVSSDSIHAVKYIRDDLRIISCGYDGHIIISDTMEKQPLLILSPSSDFEKKIGRCDISNVKFRPEHIRHHFQGAHFKAGATERIRSIENLFGNDINMLDLGIMLNPLNYVNSSSDIQEWVSFIFSHDRAAKKKTSFFNQECIFLTSLFEYLFYEADTEERNMPMIVELLNAAECKDDEKDFQSDLDRLFKLLEDKDPKHMALRHYRKFKRRSTMVQRNIIASCKSILSPLLLDVSDIFFCVENIDDLSRLVLSFISNTGAEKDILKNKRIMYESYFLTSIFFVLLTEVKSWERSLLLARNVVEDYEVIYKQLREIYPNHSALDIYDNLIDSLPKDISLSDIVSSCIERFDCLLAFYDEFK